MMVNSDWKIFRRGFVLGCWHGLFLTIYTAFQSCFVIFMYFTHDLYRITEETTTSTCMATAVRDLAPSINGDYYTKQI